MIKNEIKRGPSISYPMLMISADLVVLFVSERKGTVMTSGTAYYIGEFRDDWMPNDFREFKDVLELSNE